MNNEYNKKNQENKQQLTQTEEVNHYISRGVYLRDDHCDWGSSGMNEFTKEYSETK